MEALIALVIGVLVSCGVYLLLRARTFPVILGLTLLSYGVNLFIFVMGRLRTGAPAVVNKGDSLSSTLNYADPLPQALVLTAIVIGFAMTAFLLVLALRARAELGNDHVDGTAGLGEKPVKPVRPLEEDEV
ncbi:pH adaptation potassium efflux system C transmembrane protein [Cellvibrio sp. BR]|jgi:multicomponent K+:H+ antiporter subunit C|uniref:Na+/H+ antiporter subunit C n=1 Tax=unclassified Cellvibrio TaxID=2624793 RepID=UPI0002600DCD|nr:MULTISPECIES: Na+/H+ antiporter subunit C [unclassified Cellvibrio]EIK46526.1 pH adaptation potassium efflux system C transmembrane protein [Cellvibrio sp. BR]QEY11443.1 Na+/H+ antiporter subunit C [Cellvibrio sp. KY-YJ-3]UUA71566.1 Na+/H+ antiporter subunit C [Cellvibrio sp. QJXJ]